MRRFSRETRKFFCFFRGAAHRIGLPQRFCEAKDFLGKGDAGVNGAGMTVDIPRITRLAATRRLLPPLQGTSMTMWYADMAWMSGDSFRPYGAPPSKREARERAAPCGDAVTPSVYFADSSLKEGAKGEGRRLTATREARERATDGRMIKKGLHFFYGCDIMLRGK